MAPLDILVISEKKSLNQNLIQLALKTLEVQFTFHEASQLNSKTIQSSDWIIVDDRSIPSLQKLSEKMGETGPKKRLIYLVREGNFPKDELIPKNWVCLSKPFNPYDLQKIIIQTS